MRIGRSQTVKNWRDWDINYERLDQPRPALVVPTMSALKLWVQLIVIALHHVWYGGQRIPRLFSYYAGFATSIQCIDLPIRDGWSMRSFWLVKDKVFPW